RLASVGATEPVRTTREGVSHIDRKDAATIAKYAAKDTRTPCYTDAARSAAWIGQSQSRAVCDRSGPRPRSLVHSIPYEPNRAHLAAGRGRGIRSEKRWFSRASGERSRRCHMVHRSGWESNWP